MYVIALQRAVCAAADAHQAHGARSGSASAQRRHNLIDDCIHLVVLGDAPHADALHILRIGVIVIASLAAVRVSWRQFKDASQAAAAVS
jgi:hypothetical protein